MSLCPLQASIYHDVGIIQEPTDLLLSETSHYHISVRNGELVLFVLSNPVCVVAL